MTSTPGLAARVITLLRERGETVATAESLTGGRLAAALTAVPGASKNYVGGVVAYATSVKEELLGVSPELVERYGVISAECALAMARGAAAVTGASWGIATTGVAGPDEQDGQSVGTVYLGLAFGDKVRAIPITLTGDRAQIRAQTVVHALEAVSELMESTKPEIAE